MANARTYFGTDGVRGIFGDTLSADLVRRLGRAFGLQSESKRVLIGRDTRASGERLERVLAAGIEDAGAIAELAGVLPTPAVALLAEGDGAVISASHNPPEYNGVKFFASGGRKLSDEEELAVEELLDAPGPGGGEVVGVEGAAQRYRELVTERFGAPLDGLALVVDGANGALAGLGPRALEGLGARVTAIGDEPDGENINVGCGATDLALLSRTVRDGTYDLGVAFDGDGDRMIAVDARGEVVDGDAILAILALSLGVDTVAVTVMTNAGFHELMQASGVRVLTTDVGDRYLLEALRREGALLGGEQSGHLVYLDGHTTGDGLVAAMLLCRALAESGRTLAEEAARLEPWPQAKENVTVSTKSLTAAITDAVDELNAEHAGGARVLVRPSGTEPLVRVLAEARSEALAAELCDKLGGLVRTELG
jgi:phosphoglucosamine mutase